ncbi:MAG: TlpA disulfide reductase family protein [Acidobacteriaceae bacterium]|jgi:cytochrome c biogenesis protein CcmG, thiol:disulfide interchange protein DsbE
MENGENVGGESPGESTGRSPGASADQNVILNEGQDIGSTPDSNPGPNSVPYPDQSIGEVLVVAPQNPANATVPPLIGLVLDLGLGFCALMVLGIALLVLHRFAGRMWLPLTGALFFLVSMVTGLWSRLNPWIDGMATSLGAFFPVALIAVVALHSGGPRVWGFALLLALACGAGAQTQRLWKVRRWLEGTGVAMAAIAMVVVAGKFMPSLMTPLGQRAMNEQAPQFTVTMLDGTPVTLDSLKGRVVVMDFWGTWCEPCMAEMPAIVKVHRRYQSNAGVVFLAVNAGWHGDTGDQVRMFVERKHLDVPVALDSGATVRSLKVDGLPTLILIDRQGRIRMEETGYSADEPLESELAGQIEGLLAKQ